MDLSIIIVNYNVRFFLDRLIASIQQSDTPFQYEIIIVDNASVDDSVSYLEQYHPTVQLIKNKINVGYSKANNQALQIARGHTILYLNPDTLLESDTLRKSYDFLNQNDQVGAVGVKMRDGLGNFLPESKRGFPTLLTSIYKFTGLYKWFPRSSKINQYYQGQIAHDARANIDVLCGAFFMSRAELLKTVGGFDEAYFMYGEDIDLSYKIKKLGYEIFYLGDVQMTHYKGESTDSLSWDRLHNFYGAMSIFYAQHFGGGRLTFKSRAVQLVTKGLALFHFIFARFKLILLPAFSLLVIVLSILMAKWLWSNFYFENPDYYPPKFLRVNLPLYAGLFWLVDVVFRSARVTMTFGRVVVCSMLGLLVVLSVYALLPLEFRFSRAIPILSALIMTAIFSINLFFRDTQKKNRIKLMIVSDGNDISQAALGQLKIVVDQGQTSEEVERQIEWFRRSYAIDELIIDETAVLLSKISEWSALYAGLHRISIYSPYEEKVTVTPGKREKSKVFSFRSSYAIGRPANRFLKRCFDVLFSVSLILLFPVLIILILVNRMRLRDVFEVLSGQKTYIAYTRERSMEEKLPLLKKSIWNIDDLCSQPVAERCALNFAQNYSLILEIGHIKKALWIGSKK